MNYLLHNRQKFYESVLPRIPDADLRSAIQAIETHGQAAKLDLTEDVSDAKNLFHIDLEDAVKKPNYGEKSGMTALYAQEVLERALRLEELCYLAYSGKKDKDSVQMIDFISFRIKRLRLLLDNLRYHRIRLGKGT